MMMETATHGHTVRWQRWENAAIAAAVVVTVVALEQPWWVLLVAFLAFDLSALGYLVSPRAGALCYNMVHNYTAPALVVAGWAALELAGADAAWLVLLACCWGFHVAVDRALGYGLKLDAFHHTHLGAVGKSSPLQDQSAAA